MTSPSYPPPSVPQGSTPGHEAALTEQQSATAPMGHDPNPGQHKDKVQAVLVFQISQGIDNDDTVTILRQTLRDQIDKEPITVQEIGGVNVVVNEHGSSLKENAAKQATKLSLVRNRYISEYKVREMPDESTNDDTTNIDIGNMFVHEGDIAEDVRLYEYGRRTDPEAFKEIYGILPSEFQYIADHPVTIDILNLHATCYVSRFGRRTESFVQTFSNFIEALRNAGYPIYDVNDSEMPVTKAYEQFKAAATPVHNGLRSSSRKKRIQ